MFEISKHFLSLTMLANIFLEFLDALKLFDFLSRLVSTPNKILTMCLHSIFIAGGRDTAGLGGRGGPYRLDSGHTVFQVSDQQKAEVPEHVSSRSLFEVSYRKFQLPLYQ